MSCVLGNLRRWCELPPQRRRRQMATFVVICRRSEGGNKWQHLLPFVAIAAAATNSNICGFLSPQRRRCDMATFVAICRRSGGVDTWQHLVPFVAHRISVDLHGYPWIYRISMAIRGSTFGRTVGDDPRQGASKQIKALKNPCGGLQEVQKDKRTIPQA